jgi:hypothetical protein
MTTAGTNKLDAYVDHERLVAERYRWWGVYLIREKRRLQGIAEAVQAEEAALATRPAREGAETPEELLTRVDAEIAMVETLTEFEDEEEGETDETDLDEQPSSKGDEGGLSDEALRRKLSGKAALLGQEQREEGA